MVICLGWPSPATSSSLPAASLNNLAEVSGLFGVGHTSPPIWPCSGWGLPCHCCCQQRGGLLPHRFTLTLCSANRTRAVCSLWPFPSPCGAQALPGSLPGGARTFLGTLLGPATIMLGQWYQYSGKAGTRESGKAGKPFSRKLFPAFPPSSLTPRARSAPVPVQPAAQTAGGQDRPASTAGALAGTAPWLRRGDRAFRKPPPAAA